MGIMMDKINFEKLKEVKYRNNRIKNFVEKNN